MGCLLIILICSRRRRHTPASTNRRVSELFADLSKIFGQWAEEEEEVV
jgi:hypothetical protein